MNVKFFRKFKSFRQDTGVALLTTLLLLFLMSSLLVGFSILLTTNQRLAGSNNDQTHAFYGAEAGMEQLTAGLGNLFSQTYSPSIGQINALELTPPPVPDITYATGDGKPGYLITPLVTDARGNPAPSITTIKSGPYQGMFAMATEYVLMVNARTTAGREVTLKRTTQTVGIPMFQFGIWSDADLDFFPGPDFNFGGRTHTNGNLFLAAGSTLTLADKVDAYKDVIRTNLENGWPTSTNYTGTVQITKSPGGTNYRPLGTSEGSLTGTLGSSGNTNWPTISLGATNYAGNLCNGPGSSAPAYSTCAKQLNLGIITIGNGATQSVDLLRRPVSGEPPVVTGERYFAQASLKVLLSDDPQDIMNLPCIDSTTPPFDLSKIAVAPGAGGINWQGYAPAAALYNRLIANNVVPLPLSNSGAVPGAAGYNPGDGYWIPQGPNFSIIKGFIKIEAQLQPYGSPCGTMQDVTIEVLGLGYVGRNINPVTQSYNGVALTPQWVQPSAGTLVPLPAGLPGAALGFQNAPVMNVLPTAAYTGAALGTCPDPHPNALIRLERVRDNPSSIPWTDQTKVPKPAPAIATTAQACGYDWVTNTALALNPSDFWPNVLFDSREGTLRDVTMSAANLPTLNGAMHYIEVDTKNVTRWFGGLIGASGPNTKDPVVAPNNFLVYLSDRRGNYVQTPTWTNGWPPLSFSRHETGEYGWDDLVNQSKATSGCPDNIFDAAEDYDTTSQFYTYGADASYIHAKGTGNLAPLLPGQLGIYNTLAGTGVINSTVCTAVPPYATNDSIWPMMLAANSNAARENPPLFFRRAVKLVNGNLLTQVGACPNGVPCGLSISSENPVYIQGDFNANSGGNGFNDPSIATSVAGDAVTLLSDFWNDLNSFESPYDLSRRNGNTTWYRTAIIGGKPLYFPQPAGTGQDYGTDGGVHNFLRYVEAWGGTLQYRGSIINLFYSRQANSTFKCCNTVYSPPTRGYNFDLNFLNPTLLPPRTPLFRDINTTGWTRLLLPGQYN
jgi:hypothetical protein